MDKPRASAFGRIGETLLYLFGFWISLAALIIAMPWAPVDPFLQSTRILLLIVSGVTLVVATIGATSGLIGAFGANTKDPAPKP